MLKKLFGPDAVDEFGKQLAEDIRLRYPPTVANDPNRRVSIDRLTAILNSAFEQAAKFGGEQKLGYFKKAKLGNSFRWELKEAGYSTEFVELATEGLIVFITDSKHAAPKAPAPPKP